MEIYTDYSSIKNTIIDHIGDSKITPSSILSIITYTMNTVEKLGDGTGPDKKQLCIQIIYDIINNTDSVVDKDYILNILNNIIDPFIENIITVSKGELDINKEIKKFNFKKFLNLFKCLFNSCKK